MPNNNALKLLNIIKSLYELLKNEDISEIDYVINEMKYIITTIEESNKSKENRLEEIFVETRDVCKTFFPSHGGLTDFYIWKEDLHERKNS